LRPAAALLSAARRELVNGLASQRPSGFGAVLAALAPAPKPRSTAFCGFCESRGTSSASRKSRTQIATTPAINMSHSFLLGSAYNGRRDGAGAHAPAESASLSRVADLNPRIRVRGGCV
jgi:hypothetical protein